MVDDTETACRGSLNMKNAKLKLDPSDKQKFEISSTGKNAVRYHLRASHPTEANRWIFALTQAIQAATAESVSVDDSVMFHNRNISTGSIPAARSTASLDSRSKLPASSSAISIHTEDESDEEATDNDEEPHKGEFEVTCNSAQVQLEILEKLIGAIPQPELYRIRGENVIDAAVFENPLAVVKKAVTALHGTLDDLVGMCQTRDNHWRGRVEREKELRVLWEENMQSLAQEQEELEEKMNEAIEQRRMTKRALRAMSMAVQQPDKGAEYVRRRSISDTELVLKNPEEFVPPEELARVMSEESDEDEFFDAVGSETVTLAEEPMAPIIIRPSPPTEIGSKEQELALSSHGYEGPLRKKFEKMDKDNRPKVSLWGILKSMIGKDMTRMV
jgi:oxysterol-binding protein 1